MSLDESQTPFVASKTQKIFQNSANLQLRGHTYDASHMDKFLSSNYGEKSLGTNVTATFQAQLRRAAKEQAAQSMNSAYNQGSQSPVMVGDSLFEGNSIDERDITMETSMM